MKRSLWNRLKKESPGIRTALWDLIFPQVCEVCGKSLIKGEKYICTACLADFPFTEETYSTGKEVLEHFDEAFRPVKLHTLFYYHKYSPYKNLIYLVKYHAYRRLGICLGHMLGEKMAGSCEADCIVPIPLHKKRERKRGFNQAMEIARGIQEVLPLEILNDVVVRVKNNVSQTGKNAAERKKNVEHIFELAAPGRIRGRHVLIVDDVITTGATMEACLKVLAEAGDVKFSLGCLAQTI